MPLELHLEFRKELGVQAHFKDNILQSLDILGFWRQEGCKEWQVTPVAVEVP